MMDSVYEQQYSPRLIVIIPEELADNLDLARKIHSLARSRGCEVFYLVLQGPDENTLAVVRSLVTLKAFTSDDIIPVQSRIVPAASWKNALEEIYHPGDTLIYQSEQRLRTSLLRTTPIGDLLEQGFNAAFIKLAGFYSPRVFQMQRLLTAILAWTGFLAIIVGFFLLEGQIDQEIHGAAHTLLLFLTISVEVGALYAWNTISQRLF